MGNDRTTPGCGAVVSGPRHHNAAGYGCFIDATPADDSEFTTPGNQGEQNRMDLLTVLEHEIGHLLGNRHTDSGLINATLATGIRETPTAVIDQFFAGM
ncbi:MAG TPA: matrixin family metalloprotease [Gemmataceae bacterium]|nr:matrixin family metalloprotease [Gemmataceae bacterium]